jgi:hypothetical protein
MRIVHWHFYIRLIGNIRRHTNQLGVERLSFQQRRLVSLLAQRRQQAGVFQLKPSNNASNEILQLDDVV